MSTEAAGTQDSGLETMDANQQFQLDLAKMTNDVLGKVPPGFQAKTEASDNDGVTNFASPMGQLQQEVDEDPGKEEPEDTQEVAKSDTSEAAQDEPEQDGASEEEPKEEGPDVLALVREKLPDMVVESVDDVINELVNRTELLGGYSHLDKLGEQSEEWLQFTEMLISGEVPMVAAYKIFGEAMRAPDPDEDPEGYRAWDKEMAVLKAKRESHVSQEKDRQSREAERAKLVSESMEKQFRSLAAKHKLSTTDAQNVARRINAIIHGDPISGRIPSNAVELLYNAVMSENIASKNEADLAEREAAAEKRGYEKAMAAMKKKRGSVAEVPDLTSVSAGELDGTSRKLSQGEQLLQSLGIKQSPSFYGSDGLEGL